MLTEPPLDYVALDLETTGFYPNSCRITEIGAVRVRGGVVTDRFSQLVNPLTAIPAQITRLTGITDAMVEDCPAIEEALPAFLAWLGDGCKTGDSASMTGDKADDSGWVGETIVGHNVTFDLRFLDHAARRVLGRPFACDSIDAMRLSRTLYPGERRHRLADLIVRFGIADTEEHRALSDALQTHQCLEWMRTHAL